VSQERGSSQTETAESQKRIADNLDTVAKTLASATVAVTALLTALGISTDAVAVAFNNRPDLIWIALGAAVFAVTLSLVALLLKPSDNWLEVVLLFLGVIAYAVGLLAVVYSASDAANSAGRPTFTNITLERSGKQAKLTVRLKADGVERDRVILVVAKALKVQGQGPSVVPVGDPGTVFTTYLRPNASGGIDHQIVTPFDPADATDLTIQAWSNAEEEPSCTARRTIGSGCASVRIPPEPPVAAK
jgi:hypothetical protein